MQTTKTCCWQESSPTLTSAGWSASSSDGRAFRHFKGTTTLPVSDTGPQDLSPGPTGGRLVFGLDRRALLSAPSLPEKRSTVWNLSTAKPMRNFDKDFTPEAFFPGGNRVIGTTGSEISVRDVVTGNVMKRWPMPDGLVSILGNLRKAPRGEIPYSNESDVQSLWVSPDGSFVAAVGERPGPRMASEIPSWRERSTSLTPRQRACRRAFRFRTCRRVVF